MTIEMIMSSRVVTVDMDDSLKVVKKIFDAAHFSHLLVISRRKLVGVVSDRDYLEAISPHIGTVRETARDIASLSVKVHQIMKRHPIVLTANASINEAVCLFNRNRITCIPIIDEDYRPVGILSWRDLLMQFEEPKEEPELADGKDLAEMTRAQVMSSAELKQQQSADLAAEREMAFRQAAEKEAANMAAKEAAKAKILIAAKEAGREAAKEAAKRVVAEAARAAAREAALDAIRRPSGKPNGHL